MINAATAFIAALTVSVAAFASAAANSLTFDGKFTQGGLVIGRTDPGTKITLDGRPVRVGTDGRFIFGFGRDASPTAKLQAIFPDGSRRMRTFNIRKRKYRIQRIDGLPPRMVTPSPEQLKRIRAEAEDIRAARAVFSQTPYFAEGFIWPAHGRISGVYGSQRILNGEPRRPHLGVDVAAPRGTPVMATASGKVSLARPDLYFTGGTVIIDHGFGLSSVYSHLDRVETKTGAFVRQGQVIGRLGATGRATGAHLDWRINWFQERLDPALLVGPMPTK